MTLLKHLKLIGEQRGNTLLRRLIAVTSTVRKGMMYDEEWGEIVSLGLEEDFRLPT